MIERNVRHVKNPSEEKSSEEELLEFCNSQIIKMQRYLKLGDADGFPSYFEINRALMDHHRIYLSLLTLYASVKHEYNEAKENYENWYAEKYTQIRQEENPKNVTASKWISTKEIEFTVRMRFTQEHNQLKSEVNLLEEKLSFVRRTVDGWSSHQYILVQLSKNVNGEIRSSSLGE